MGVSAVQEADGVSRANHVWQARPRVTARRSWSTADLLVADVLVGRPAAMSKCCLAHIATQLAAVQSAPVPSQTHVRSLQLVRLMTKPARHSSMSFPPR